MFWRGSLHTAKDRGDEDLDTELRAKLGAKLTSKGTAHFFAATGSNGL
ncbi:hypothetical protein GCM10027180_29350 [Microbulbifer echini]